MELFRRRALLATFCMMVLGVVALVLSISEASIFWQGMLDHALWAMIVSILIGVVFVATVVWRRFRLARLLIVTETGAIIGTWGLAQLPYIVPPSLTVTAAASPPITLLELFISALVGMSMLIPALWFLFHVFKGSNVVPPIREKEVQEVQEV